MSMKTGILFVLAGCLALPAVLRAQGKWKRGNKDGPGAEEKLERLEKALELGEEQKKKIGKILEEAEPEEKKLREEMAALREKMRALGERAQAAERKTHEKVRGELDGKQRDKFDELRVRLRGRSPGGQGGGGGFRPGGPGGMPHERFRRRGDGNWDGHELPPGGMGGPERWEMEPRRGREELPDELRERIEHRRMMRQGQGDGEQRDIPPREDWGEEEGIHGYDRVPGMFNEPPERPQGNE